MKVAANNSPSPFGPEGPLSRFISAFRPRPLEPEQFIANMKEFRVYDRVRARSGPYADQLIPVGDNFEDFFDRISNWTQMASKEGILTRAHVAALEDVIKNKRIEAHVQSRDVDVKKNLARWDQLANPVRATLQIASAHAPV